MSAILYRRAKIEAHRLVDELGDTIAFAAGPEAAVRNLGVQVVDRAVVGGDCPIAATYESGPPPTISVTPTPSQGRRHFSILHEYGHHLSSNSWRTVELLADYPNQRDANYLQETICDIVAAELLLPGTLTAHVDRKGPTAANIVTLFETSQASREACCVKAAQLIAAHGYVMLADLDGTARFTAAVRTVFRVRRDTAQPADGAIARAAASGHYRGVGHVRFSTGNTSPDHYVDAQRLGAYVFAVFYGDSPPWEKLSIGAPDRGRWIGDELECEHCEFVGVTHEPRCRLCGQRRCPNCGRCGFTDDFRRCPGDFPERSGQIVQIGRSSLSRCREQPGGIRRRPTNGQAATHQPQGRQGGVKGSTRRSDVEDVEDSCRVRPLPAGSQERIREEAMTVDGAIIREQGVTFGIIVVKPHALNNVASRDDLVRQASAAFGGIPTILMAQSGRNVRYWGRPDLVRFMRNVPLAAVPWKRYRLGSA